MYPPLAVPPGPLVGPSLLYSSCRWGAAASTAETESAIGASGRFGRLRAGTGS
jgi:hypothetical protein